MGLSRIGDEPVAPHDGPAALLLPAGAAGPAFLVFRNFDAIYSYNAAEGYALAIAHLSTGSKGAAISVASWPTDDQVSPAPSDARTADLAARAWPRHRRGGRDDRKPHPGSHQGRTGAAGLRGKTVARTQDPDALRPPASPNPDAAPLSDARCAGDSAKGTVLAAPHRVGEHRRAKQLEPFLERAKADPCDELWCRLRGHARASQAGASKIWLSSNAPAATNITPIKGSRQARRRHIRQPVAPMPQPRQAKGPQHQYAADMRLPSGRPRGRGSRRR